VRRLSASAIAIFDVTDASPKPDQRFTRLRPARISRTGAASPSRCEGRAARQDAESPWEEQRTTTAFTLSTSRTARRRSPDPGHKVDAQGGKGEGRRHGDGRCEPERKRVTVGRRTPTAGDCALDSLQPYGFAPSATCTDGGAMTGLPEVSGRVLTMRVRRGSRKTIDSRTRKGGRTIDFASSMRGSIGQEPFLRRRSSGRLNAVAQ